MPEVERFLSEEKSLCPYFSRYFTGSCLKLDKGLDKCHDVWLSWAEAMTSKHAYMCAALK